MVGPVDMNVAWNLVAGTTTRYLLLAVNVCLGIFLMPYTVRHLGTAEYGLWMLAASMTAYFQLLDLGYGSGLVRHLSAADAQRDATLVNRLLSTFVIVYAGIGLLAAVGIASLVIWALPRFPRLAPSEIAEARFVLVVVGIRVAVGFPMTVFGAATTARQRFALTNLVATAAALLNGALTFALLALGYRVRAVVVASTAVSLASYVGYAWAARRAFPDLRLGTAAFSLPLVRQVTAFSMYTFIIDVAVQINFNLDNLVIGAAVGTAAVAVFAVALRLADFQRQLCNQLNGLMFPIVVRFNASDEPRALERLRAMMIDGTRIALTLVLGITVCLMTFAGPLISRWMGPGFEASVLPLSVLAVAGIVLVGQGPADNILLGTGRHQLVAYVALGEALANLVLSVVLVRSYGILGVAIGTAVPVVVANLFILQPAACRQVQLGLRGFVRTVAVAPGVGAIVSAVAGVALRVAIQPQSIAGVASEGAVVGAAYLIAVWLFGFDHAVRARYLTYARRAFVSLVAVPDSLSRRPGTTPATI
jgi:O-antigen/teichoic acid export membrane protein